MEPTQAIRETAERARRQPPASGDSSFEVLQQARAGEPRAVMSPEGGIAFWIVPYVRGGSICGFAQVDLGGRVSRVAVLGSGDPASWIAASFFAKAPAGALEEIRAKHPGESLPEPVFSYDFNPAQWGWRIVGRDWTAFIGPGGWYDRPSGQPRNPVLEA